MKAGTERLSLYLPSLDNGGAERVMVNLASWFAEVGHQVDLLVGSAGGAYSSQLHPKIRLVDFQQTQVVKTLPRFVRYLRTERPRAVLSAIDHANLVAIAARRIAGIETRIVVSTHGCLVPAPAHHVGAKQRVLPALIRHLYPLADGVVAVSETVAADLSRTTRLPRERIKVIYNPVVTPSILKMAQERTQHPWFRTGEPVIVSAGRLVPEKDFPTLIEAVSIIRSRRPVKLIILGEGDERPKIMEAIKRHGLGADVQLMGYVENPLAYMAQAGVFVLPSRVEGFGNVLVEAMVCGTPVVSTSSSGGPSEILQNGEYGGLVPSGDVSAMANAIMDALDGPRNEQRLIQRAMSFSVEGTGRLYLQLLLGNSPLGSSHP